MTRMYGKILGPCFKTGRVEGLLQRHSSYIAPVSQLAQRNRQNITAANGQQQAEASISNRYPRALSPAAILNPMGTKPTMEQLVNHRNRTYPLCRMQAG